MLEIASQMILCLLLAALLGFIIGYLFGKMTCAGDDCAQKEEDSSHDVSHNNTPDTHAHTATDTSPTSLMSSTAGTTKYTAPQVLNKARNGVKDDLTKIKGLNSGFEASLNHHGIYHYDQVASWSDENVAWADTTLGLKGKATEDNWVAQAKTLDISSDASISTATSSAKETVNGNKQTPQVLTAPRDGSKDHLSKIKGIGAKIEDALNEIGIYHFDQIAAWTDKNIEWADNSLGFPGRANREKWVEQAKLLASGEETEFSKRVDAGEVASSK